MRKQAERYLNSVLPIMRLSQWMVKVSNDIPEDDAWADIEVSQNLWEATIRLNNDFFRESPESQRRILAHELCHIHHAALERFLEPINGVLGSQAYEVLDKLWDTETERIADTFSFLIAERMPLPAFTEKASK